MATNRSRELRVVLTGDASGLQAAADDGVGALDLLGGAAATAGAAVAAGLAAGGYAVGSAVNDAAVASGQLQAQLGLTAEEARAFDEVTRDVFAGNFGDSMADAAGSVTLIHQALGVTGEELEDRTVDILSMSDAFGHLGADAPILAENVRTMTAAFPGLDQADALDLITASLQAGTGSAGDLTDTLQEYPNLFADLGLSAQDMFTVLDAGMAAGARNTDVVADAIKELGIRVNTAGDTGQEAIGRLFPADDAQRIIDQFGAGGDAARDAMREIAVALADVTDPQERYNAAVELFGTKAEDLGRGGIDALLGAMADLSGTTGDIADATDTLGAQYAGIGPLISGVWRNIQVGIADAAQPLIDTYGPQLQAWAADLGPRIAGVFDGLINWWTDHGPAITTAVQAVGSVIGSVMDGIGTAVETVAGWFSSVFGDDSPARGHLDTFAANVSDWAGQIFEIYATMAEAVQALIDRALEAIQWAWEAFGEDILEYLQEAFTNIQTLIGGVLDVIQGIWETFAGIFTGDWERVWDGIKQIFAGVWEAIQGILAQALNVIDTALSIALTALARLWEQVWNGIKAVFEAVWNGIRAVFDAQWALLRGAWDTATGALASAWDLYTDALKAVWDHTFGAFITILQTQWAVLRGIWDGLTGGIATAWDAFTGGIADVWNRLWDGLTSGFGTVRDTITGAIQGLVDSVTTIWDGVRNVLAAPINWVAEHVINGLIGAVNRVSGALGAGDLLTPLEVPLIPTFHNGGVVGRDFTLTPVGPLSDGERLAKVKDGEEVIPASDPRHVDNIAGTGGDPADPGVVVPTGSGSAAPQTRILGGVGEALGAIGSAIGDAALGALQEVRQLIVATIRPAIEGIADLSGSAIERFGPPGELVAGAGRTLVDLALDWLAGVDDDVDAAIGSSGLGRALEAARAADPWPYVWGGVGPGGADCSGFQSYLANVAMAKANPHQRIFSTASIVPGGAGPFRPGIGPGPDNGYVIGVVPTRDGKIGHTSGTILGTNVESRGSAGVVVGPSARPWNHPMYTHTFHFAGLAQGGTTTQPGVHMVGENGPELLNLPRQSTIIPLRPGWTLTGDPFSSAAGGRTVHDDLADLVAASAAAVEDLVTAWSTTVTAVDEIADRIDDTTDQLAGDVVATLDDMADRSGDALDGLAGGVDQFVDEVLAAAERLAAATPAQPQPGRQPLGRIPTVRLAGTWKG